MLLLRILGENKCLVACHAGVHIPMYYFPHACVMPTTSCSMELATAVTCAHRGACHGKPYIGHDACCTSQVPAVSHRPQAGGSRYASRIWVYVTALLQCLATALFPSATHHTVGSGCAHTEAEVCASHIGELLSNSQALQQPVPPSASLEAAPTLSIQLSSRVFRAASCGLVTTRGATWSGDASIGA